jgi:hypothetical protein
MNLFEFLKGLLRYIFVRGSKNLLDKIKFCCYVSVVFREITLEYFTECNPCFLIQKQRAPGLHCMENSKQIFPEMKLHGLVPNFYIHVSVCDLYFPTIGPPILLYCVWGPIMGIYKSLKDT